MKKYSLYMHTNLNNNKKYVGITSRKPHRRWGKDGNGYKSQPYFFSAIQKHGWDSFTHDVLFENLTYDEVLEKEIEFAKKYKTLDRNFGYNLVVGKKGIINLSEETREKYIEHLTGETNPMYGKKHTKETIEKLKRINTENAMYGSDNPASRSIRGTNLKTGETIEFESANQAALHFGLFNNSHIIECCRGKRNKCKDHKWEYLN